MRDSHRRLLDWIESDKERSIGLLQEFTRIDTSNPPGDTRAGASFLCRILDRERLDYNIVAPRESMPNVIAAFDCGSPGRHLILNGHIDVFPAGDMRRWSRDPWCGDLVDGRVFGRGTVDMKCGTCASLLTYAYLHRLRHELKGRLTLTLVSDEETGGHWGARYLLENCADQVMGDCVLNAEPSSPHTIRFGEKSTLWLTFRVKTPGGHGAYPHLSASATKIAARLIGDLEQLESLRPQAPDEVDRILESPGIGAAVDRALGLGGADVARRLTINIGTVHGGVKANMLPGDCVIEADIRLPIGLDWERVMVAVNAILKNYPEVSLDPPPGHTMNATWCDPEHEMVRIMQDNVQSLRGFRPPAIVSLGGTDCRFWRAKGVPAYVYGPSPEGMGKPNESVSIDEFLHVVNTHVLSAYDYLNR